MRVTGALSNTATIRAGPSKPVEKGDMRTLLEMAHNSIGGKVKDMTEETSN